jgi:hypothetical protein
MQAHKISKIYSFVIFAFLVFPLPVFADGDIFAWGWNNYSQCTVPDTNAGFVAIAAGGYHSLGIKQDGSIAAWGRNDYGQCNVPLPNTDFIAVAAGNTHSLGLKTNGSILAWGSNNSGQCNVPEPNTNFTAVSAGWNFSLGIKQQDLIVAWGYNNYGECNVPLSNANFAVISAGGYHSLGLKRNPVTLTIQTEPPEVNTVTPPVGTHLYSYGQKIDLIAQRFVNCPDVYIFDYWVGDVNDPYSSKATIIMDANETVTPVFVDGRQCNDECHPVLKADLNDDCHVDLEDFASFSAQWLNCTDPNCD